MTELTEEHEAFRAAVRRYVADELDPRVDAWEAAGEMPLHEIFADMARLGFLGLEFPTEVGGQGADHLFTLVLGEELGRMGHGSLPMAIGVQVATANPSLAAHGSDELRAAYLAPALRGEQVASIAVTEPDAGSDVAAIRTRARRDGGDWVINGAKTYITNGVQADWLCLLARTSAEGGYRGMSQIVVPTDVAGFEVSRKLDKLGMRASDTALLTFDDVRVPVTNTIGDAGRGFQQQMSQFIVERLWGVYGTPTGCAEALRRTRDYLRQRQAFGAPLIANQYLQYRLAELAAEVDLLLVYNRELARRHAAGEDVTREATIAKLKAGRLQREVADEVLQFHGGIGYMEETWTARYLRDTRLLSIGAGADEVMLRVLSTIDGFCPAR
jgi:citronellyl-CoA dehydrogenase